LQEVIVFSVRGGKHSRQQGCEGQKSLFAKMRPVFDLGPSAVRCQHPNRNLQSTSAWFHDRDCTITGLGSTNDSEDLAMQWVKGIENLNVSRFRTQGIVGAGVLIRIFIA
jgi:hypothetical protein